MSRIHLTSYIIAATLLTSSCTTAAPDAAPPTVAPSATNPALVDPQLGYTTSAADPKTPARYSRAVQSLSAGRTADAEKRLTEITERDPRFAPAALLLARIAIERGEYERAAELIERARAGNPGYVAADVYEAELALARGDRERAYEIYSTLAQTVSLADVSRARLEELRTERFAALVSRAQGESGEAAIASFRDALALREDEPVRLALVRELIEQERYDDARRELEPILTRSADKDEVQEILAALDIARGRYQEAIFRLERLTRRGTSPRYAERLAEAKRLFSEANMPPHYRRALETESLTRADFAVLLFWKVSAVRFANNLRQPPIAVDIADVPGREELVRALALGLFAVDPVTRSVGPYRTVDAAAFSRLAGRVLALRGALPQCASTVAESNETLRAQKMLDQCGIDIAPLQAGGSISGAYASRVLERVDALLASAK